MDKIQSIQNANCPDGNLRIAEQMYIKCSTLLIHSFSVWGSRQVKLSTKIGEFQRIAGTAMVYSKRLSTHGRPRDLENSVNLRGIL